MRDSCDAPGLDQSPLVLLAPLTGPLVPIDQVPDPVFSQKPVGDGVSIDPESSCLRAPCDARVLQVHAAGHAVTLLAEPGVEVMIHIGLDTVGLKGEGFLPRVRAGDPVKAGDPLIEFAVDYVATHARSLLTEIVVPGSDRVASLASRTGYVVAGRDPILEIRLAAPAGAGDPRGRGSGAFVDREPGSFESAGLLQRVGKRHVPRRDPRPLARPSSGDRNRGARPRDPGRHASRTRRLSRDAAPASGRGGARSDPRAPGPPSGAASQRGGKRQRAGRHPGRRPHRGRRTRRRRGRGAAGASAGRG